MRSFIWVFVLCAAVSFGAAEGRALTPLAGVALAATARPNNPQALKRFEEAEERFERYIEQGHDRRAIKFGRKALRLAKNLRSVAPERKAEIALKLGNLYEGLNDGEKSVESSYAMYEVAIQYLDEAFGPGSAEHFTVFLNVTGLSVREENTEIAREHLQKLDMVIDQHFDFPSNERASFNLVSARVITLDVFKNFKAGVLNPYVSELRKVLGTAVEDLKQTENWIRAGTTLGLLAKWDLMASDGLKAETHALQSLEVLKTAELTQDSSQVQGIHSFLVALYTRQENSEAVKRHIEQMTKSPTGGALLGIIPVFRTPPHYPPRATSYGMQGWVLIEIDLGPNGDVRNPVVLDASPENWFEDEALRAVKKWRYVPLMTKGEYVAIKTAVVLSFTFSN